MLPIKRRKKKKKGNWQWGAKKGRGARQGKERGGEKKNFSASAPAPVVKGGKNGKGRRHALALRSKYGEEKQGPFFPCFFEGKGTPKKRVKKEKGGKRR